MIHSRPGRYGPGCRQGVKTSTQINKTRTHLLKKRRASFPGGRFPPSFIHEVFMITGLNKLYDCMYVLTLKMVALDANRA